MKTESSDPRWAFRAALRRYRGALLEQIIERRGVRTESAHPGVLASTLALQPDTSGEAAELLDRMDPGSTQALGFFALAEARTYPLAGLWHGLTAVGVDPGRALADLLEHGLLAIEPLDKSISVEEFATWIGPAPARAVDLRIHPAVARGAKVARPDGKLPPVVGQVGQIRESDGLGPIIRLAAIWQRVRLEPLRQTQQGVLYKRDQERMDGDLILSEAGTDSLEPLPALPSFWLALARRVGLIVSESPGDRLVAAGTEFWIDNAVHLQQMIAAGWFGLRSWREWEPGPGERADSGASLAFLRIPPLLWLATLEDHEWAAIDDLAEHLSSLNPQWDRLSVRSEPGAAAPESRRVGARGKAQGSAAPPVPRGPHALRLLLLGAAAPLGLVRAGEERESRRVVVQLTPLGRYVLAMAPPPTPRPVIDHFLFVQPNLEMIAYREGLNPRLVGELSRFAWWTKIGAALELKLSQESVVLGLESGVTPSQMIEVLSRHSQRPLPGLIADAITRWAGRREQLSVYIAATLLEFSSREERDQALAAWNAPDPQAFLPVAERLLLVENPQLVPTDRIISKGSRDYRLPPEKCITVEPDGVTLALDPARSDLLIDAELSRIADENQRETLGRSSDRAGSQAEVRRYLVSRASLERAAGMGVTPAQITDWFVRRTGRPPTPALKLLLRPVQAGPTVLPARRMLVVVTPTAEMADGLIQHPATSDLIGERLGPTALSLPEDALEPMRQALHELGFALEVE